MAIWIYVTKPGTPLPETCTAYCKAKGEEETDLRIDYADLHAWVEAQSEPYLDEAVIDYAEEKMGGQLTIKAPNARMSQVTDDSPLEDRINYILYNEVNPSLASHGGMVTLHELVDGEQGKTAVLQFGGGCQGCGMVDVTLKEGVERTLREKLPDLAEVVDVTDHTQRENAYYK